MAIYRYSMLKYAKSYSTWIIILISMVITVFIGVLLPFKFTPTDTNDASIVYGVAMLSVTSGTTSFLSLFMSIFSGYKVSTMIVDEVEDGSFLFVVSKPVSRTKIVLMKWLALQTFMIIYCFLVILSFIIAVIALDVGDQIPSLSSWGVKKMSDSIFQISIVMFAIMLVFGFFFSSLSFMISSFANSAATIGISIGVGIIVPITSTISMFAHNREYETFNRADMIGVKQFDLKENFNSYLRDNSDNSDVQAFQEILETSGVSEHLNQLFDNYDDNLGSMMDFLQHDQNGFYNLAVKNGDSDGLSYLYPFDLDYHFRNVSTIAIDGVTTNDFYEASKNKDNTDATFIPPSDVDVIRDIESSSELERMVTESLDRMKSWRNSVFDIVSLAVAPMTMIEVDDDVNAYISSIKLHEYTLDHLNAIGIKWNEIGIYEDNGDYHISTNTVPLFMAELAKLIERPNDMTYLPDVKDTTNELPLFTRQVMPAGTFIDSIYGPSSYSNQIGTYGYIGGQRARGFVDALSCSINELLEVISKVDDDIINLGSMAMNLLETAVSPIKHLVNLGFIGNEGIYDDGSVNLNRTLDYSLSNGDRTVVTLIAQYINLHPDAIAKVEIKDYANKYILLLIYGLLGLSMFTIGLIIYRKRNYR